MTKIIRDQEISGVEDQIGTTLEDYEFHNCAFRSIFPAGFRAGDPAKRTTLRNVLFKNCAVGPSVYGDHSFFDNVTIDGLKIRNGSDNSWWIRGSAYRHVTLKGRIGSLRLTQSIITTGNKPEERGDRFNQDNADFYGDVDWAIDISRATFNVAPEFRNVPGRLIVHNPTTAVVVTRERAERINWESLDWGRCWFDVSIADMLNGEMESQLLVAPSKSKYRDDFMRALDQMRAVGLTEPLEDLGIVGEQSLTSMSSPRQHTRGV